MIFSYHDGGRLKAGYRGHTGDCVTRAIAIATGYDYEQVYAELTARSKHRGGKTARHGIPREVYEPYLHEHGWAWFPTMTIGSGCRVHLKADELPRGTLIVRLSRHVVAVRDGVLYDTYDSSRNGTRCVYGYFTKGA